MSKLSVPGGVKVVAFLHFLFAAYCGVVTLVCAWAALFGSGGSSFLLGGSGWRGLAGVLALIFGVMSACFGGVGLGLVRGAKPARWIAVAFSLLALWTLWSTGSWTWLGIHVGIAGYLSFSDSVAKAFA